MMLMYVLCAKELRASASVGVMVMEVLFDVSEMYYMIIKLGSLVHIITAKKLFRAVMESPMAMIHASGMSSSKPSIIVDKTNFIFASALTKSKA